MENEQKTKIPNARKQKKETQIALVQQLMLKGVSNAEQIQAALKTMTPPVVLTTRTIYFYKGIIIRRNMETLKSKEGLTQTISEIALELKQTNEEVLRQLWIQYHSALAGPGDKIRALAEIRKTVAEKTELLQSMGLVHEEPVKFQQIGKDGKPVDPTVTNKSVLVGDFLAFIKARYQTPVGSEKQVREEKKKEALKTVAELPLVLTAEKKNYTPLPITVMP